MTQIYDLSNPAKPVFIRDFGLVGQQPGAGVLQIVDREKLLNGAKDPTPENLLASQIARLDLPPMHGAHILALTGAARNIADWKSAAK